MGASARARLGGVATAAAALGAAATAPSPPPNVLLLMADQFRADALNPTTAPNLFALSQEGLRFNAFYSSTPTCTPARAALLTGRSPWGHGMLGYGVVAPQYPLEMPPYLNSLGYETAVVGKNHFWTADGENASTVPHHGYGYSALYDGLGDGMHASTGELDSYDVWFAGQTGGKDPLASCGLDWNSWRGCASGYEYDEALHPTAWVGATARAWLAARRERAAASSAPPLPPYFLKVSFHRPHSPYDPPQRLYNATPAVLPPPVVAADGWDANFTTNGKYCGPDGADAWCGTMPEPAATVARRSYLASVAFVDETVGALLADVNRSDTWVIFLSDHGDGQGDHGLWRKGYPWELSAHVPGALVWPTGYAASIPRGSASDELVEVRDIFPTAAAVGGGWPLPAPHVVEGTPLTCLVGGPAAPAECAAYAAASPLLRVPGSGAGAPVAAAGNAAPTSGTNGGFVWRSSLDLEHDIVYNATIHWNALVGAGRTAAAPAGHRIKYVYLAMWGAEQLFDVTADPGETTDLAGHAGWAAELAAWRAAMAAQFTAEGRGPAWVTEAGALVPRPAGQLCSPNYPSAYRQYCG